jgi:hypothetical protein
MKTLTLSLFIAGAQLALAQQSEVVCDKQTTRTCIRWKAYSGSDVKPVITGELVPLRDAGSLATSAPEPKVTDFTFAGFRMADDLGVYVSFGLEKDGSLTAKGSDGKVLASVSPDGIVSGDPQYVMQELARIFNRLHNIEKETGK